MPAERSHALDMITARYYDEKTSIFWNLMEVAYRPNFLFSEMQIGCCFWGAYSVQYSFPSLSFRQNTTPIMRCSIQTTNG
jgi:hypothetical protein